MPAFFFAIHRATAIHRLLAAIRRTMVSPVLKSAYLYVQSIN